MYLSWLPEWQLWMLSLSHMVSCLWVEPFMKTHETLSVQSVTLLHMRVDDLEQLWLTHKNQDTFFWHVCAYIQHVLFFIWVCSYMHPCSNSCHTTYGSLPCLNAIYATWGVEIIANGSGSHHQLRLLLFMGKTQRQTRISCAMGIEGMMGWDWVLRFGRV